MAAVTTGMSGDEQAVVILSDDEQAVVFLTPDQARRFAVQLIEKAHHLDKPAAVSDWP